MRWQRWPAVVARYGTAVAAALLAVLARWELMPQLGPVGPYLTVSPVVFAIALLLGAGPALLGAIAGILAVELALLPRVAGVLMTRTGEPARIVLIILTTAGMVLLARQARTAKAMAAWRAALASRAERKARASERRARARANELAAVLDAAPVAVFVTRERSAQHVEGNRFCSEMLRLPPGGNLSMSPPEGQRPDAFRFCRHGREVPPEQLPVQVAAARGIEVRASELQLVHEDGSVRDLIGNATPLRNGRGLVRGAVGAFADVTGLKRVERQLVEADRRKDEFLAVLSHELRNPLMPIGNALFLLKRAPPGSAQAERALDVVGRQTEHLSRLVDELLDQSRIVHGTIELKRSRLDLAARVRTAVEDRRPEFERATVALELRTEAPPIWLDADPTRIDQIVGNLLSNAVRFTPSGGRVVVTARTEGPWGWVQVADSGVGMTPEMLARLFEPFAQEAPGLARSRGGLGLGLALVKGLVELHGGTVSAHSDGLGRGSAFEVRLPVVAVASAGAGEEEEAEPPPPPTAPG